MSFKSEGVVCRVPGLGEDVEALAAAAERWERIGYADREIIAQANLESVSAADEISFEDEVLIGGVRLEMEGERLAVEGGG